jgi:MFS family permease
LLAHPLRRSSRAVAERRAATLPTGRRTALLVAVFGLIAACTAYGEGALAEWGPLHIQEDLHGGPGIAAAGYAAVALAMTLGRLSGTTLLVRLGQTRVLVLGGLTACAGMLLGALAPLIPLVVLGFALTGLGLANLFPTAIARAGELTGPSGVAAASTLGYAGMLLGPPSIGFLTDAFGLPTALTTVAALAAVAAGIAYAVRHSGSSGGTTEVAGGDSGGSRGGPDEGSYEGTSAGPGHGRRPGSPRGSRPLV